MERGAWILLALALAGCGGEEGMDAGRRQGAESITGRQALTLEDLGEATVDGIYDRPFRLSQGRYEGPPFQEGGAARPQVVLSERLVALADVDGDGDQEAGSLLEESSGGTGRFVHLAVFQRVDGEVRTVHTALLGDRIQVRSLRAEGARLVVEAVAAGPEDAACCPTMKTTYAASSGEDGLSIERTQAGRVALTDLAGIWRLARFAGIVEEAGRGARVGDVEVTLQLEADGRLSGSSGCNRYSGEVRSPSGPQSLEVGGVATTGRMCGPEESAVETRFLAALGSASRYSWHDGRLLLESTDDPRFEALFFDPAAR